MNSLIEGKATQQDVEKCALLHYSHVHGDNEFFLLWVEAKLLAARDARFRVHFNIILRERLERLAGYIRECPARAGVPLPPETLALGLMGLCDGIQFFYAIDPQNATGDMARSVLADFFARVCSGMR